MTDPRHNYTQQYPIRAAAASPLLERVEPLLTPSRLKSRFLKNLDIGDYSNEDLDDQIKLACNEFELLTKLTLMPTEYYERVPFDRDLYRSMVFIRVNNAPILTIKSIDVVSSNRENIYTLPPTWIELGQIHNRQINVMPILSIFGSPALQQNSQVASAMIFIQSVNNFAWLPSFWEVKMVCGMSSKEGQVPIIANQLIGTLATLNILSMLGPINRTTSESISQDGISQASSNPGPNLYTVRIQELTAKKEELLSQIKGIFSQKMFVSYI